MGRTLGPFPKTLRWREILELSLPPKLLSQAPAISEATLTELQAVYEALTQDEAAFKAITFLVALPVSTRHPDPASSLKSDFGIDVPASPELENLLMALTVFEPTGALITKAAARTMTSFIERHQAKALFDADPWAVWRDADGSAFCDLAPLFFDQVNELYFSQSLRDVGAEVDQETVTRFAHEMAVITRAFSARWFNACARYQVPEEGSIRWYLGHCLGKLDLELAREHADWIEPTGNPWKRRKRVETSLPL